MSCNVEPSIFEHLHGTFCCALTAPKNRFVEHFDGDTLCLDRWNLNNFINVNTFQMSDEVDGGFEIITAAASPAIGVICFNNQRTFCPTASEIIYVIRGESTTSANMGAGFDNNLQTCASNDHAWGAFTTASCCFQLRSACCNCITGTDLCVAKDTSYHVFKQDMKTCDIDIYIDCLTCVAGTATTNLPNCDQNPVFFSQTVEAVSKTAHILYMEAWNK